MPFWSFIESQIQSIQPDFAFSHQRAQGGGCINEAFVVFGSGDDAYFVKRNKAHVSAMFEAEFLALSEMGAFIRTPKPLLWGEFGEYSYLLMQYIPIQNTGDMAAMGIALAAMHQHRQEQFGWHRDNFIGASVQTNTPHEHWGDFWRDSRLLAICQLAEGRAMPRRIIAKAERLAANCDGFFAGETIRPSLLHGDLWSGNASFDQQGRPLLFDPALYYGHHEVDLAMSELFGGFSPDFYAAYRDHYPVSPAYAQRKQLYNLYHIINHFVLFGGAYESQAEQMIDRLLAELL